jgi:hypothetical protein
VQEVELAEVLDHLAADRALECDLELLERLVGGAGRLDPALAAVGLPAQTDQYSSMKERARVKGRSRTAGSWPSGRAA